MGKQRIDLSGMDLSSFDEAPKPKKKIDLSGMDLSSFDEGEKKNGTKNGGNTSITPSKIYGDNPFGGKPVNEFIGKENATRINREVASKPITRTQEEINRTESPETSLYDDVAGFVSAPIQSSARYLTTGTKAVSNAIFGEPKKTMDDYINEIDVPKPEAPRKLKYDAEYLQKVSETVDANKFADGIEKSGEPNSKEIAQGIRDRNKQWFDLPVDERKAVRDFNTLQDEEKNISDLNSFNVEQQRLNSEIVAENERLQNTVSFVGSNDDFAKINSLSRRLDELKVKKGYLELKPQIFKSSIFKDDQEILQNLGGEIQQVLTDISVNDPSKYERLYSQFNSQWGNVSGKEKRDLINSAISIKNNKLEADFNEAKNSGVISRVNDYLKEVRTFKSYVESGNENAARMQQRVLQGYRETGIDNMLSMVNDISKQEEDISDIVKSSSVKYDILHDQNKQKEVDEFVKGNPFLGRVWEFAKSAYSVLPKTVGQGIGIGEVIGNTLSGDAEASRKNVGIQKFKEFVDLLTPTKAKLSMLKDNNDIDWGNVVNATGDQIATMAVLLSAGGRIGGALKSLGVGSKVAASSGLIASSFALSKGDYYNNAVSAGMKSKDATAFANQAAGLTSLLELVSPNDLILTGQVKSAITKEFAKYFTKGGMKYALGQSAKRIIVESIGKELPQEISQLLGDKFLELAYNRTKGTKFNENITHNELKQTVIGTIAATSILTAARNRSANNQERQQYLYEASKDMPALKLTLDGMNLSQEDVNKVLTAATAYRKAYDATPAGLEEKIKSSVAPLLVAKQKLQQDALAENLDPAFKTAINERIKIIDNTIVGITNGTLDPKKVNISDDPIEAVKNTEENIKNGTNIMSETGLEAGKENLDDDGEIVDTTVEATPIVDEAKVTDVATETLTVAPIAETTPKQETQATPTQKVEEIVGSGTVLDVRNKGVSPKKKNVEKSNEIKNNKSNLREQDGSVSNDNRDEFNRLTKEYNELENESNSDAVERVRNTSVDDTIKNSPELDNSGEGVRYDMADAIGDALLKDGYTQEQVDYIIGRESRVKTYRGIAERYNKTTKHNKQSLPTQELKGSTTQSTEVAKEAVEPLATKPTQETDKSNLDLEFIAEDNIPKEIVDAYNKKGKLAGTTQVPNEKILAKQNEIRTNLETLKKFTKCLTA